MMRFLMTESTFCRYIVGKFRELGARVTRIENIVTSGAPDINLQVYGTEAWIECKMCANAGGSHTADLRPAQFAWHSDQVRAGGNAFIVVFNKTTDTVALFESVDVVKINEAGFVSDIRGAKPKFSCPKKLFIKTFLDNYCESIPMDLRPQPVETTPNITTVAF